MSQQMRSPAIDLALGIPANGACEQGAVILTLLFDIPVGNMLAQRNGRLVTAARCGAVRRSPRNGVDR